MLALLENDPRDYAWGSATLIARLQGREPTGRPEAEVWFGDHPGSPARLAGAGTLDAWLDAHAGGARLGYLLKLLAAASPLSIQVHPSKAQAEAGFAAETAAGIPLDAAGRNYRDDNHKPEVIVAVSSRFEALAGLREVAATRRLLAGLGESAGVTAVRERLRGPDAEALRDTLGWLLSGEAGSEVDDVIASLATAESDEFAAELAVARRIAAAYPGDPGVVVALLMNLVVLQRGEAIFAPAGSLHAYLDGLGVELMAASDNVLRGGLTPKHIDVPELLRVVDTTPAAPPRILPEPVSDGVEAFRPGIPDFELWRVRADEAAPRTLALHGPAIVLAVGGAVRVNGRSGETVELTPGTAAFATQDESELVVSGAGEVFVALPGR
ncbi:mannose-6-phosphate isomerase, class I [Microbacterium sp. SORGH_AS_0888]|uniref:mannose-6-phosphate isomerase, class I n=1 Tax=Microbacterium sp. SORGH_AS_0888 TaxID=3041791 RepID=UPI0027D795B1|nr:mannose-6-phosphate isomerase, class I [Microbacterium sp. SORGH_AS_0888]